MRTEPSRFRKSSTWPKIVLKKWLNIRSSSNDFLSDSNNHKGGVLKRRNSCSDKEKCFLITKDSLGPLSLSLGHGGWLVNIPQPDPIPPSQNLRMFVGTWNVGGKAPHEGLNLRDWLLGSQAADLYVIGFQEIVPLNAGNVLGAEDVGPAAKWISLIRRALNGGGGGADSDASSDEEDGGSGRPYYLAASKQMVGIFMCVWARAGVAEHVRNVKVSCVGTGIIGYMGNKGSVSISMTIRRSTLCFVCSHLTSGEKEGDELRRNSDVMEIQRRTRFPRAAAIAPTKILHHDKIIWLGDLNYRLTPGFSDTRELLEEEDWKALLERDQLGIEQRAGRLLKGFEEGRINFPPTYKYLPNSNCYAFTFTTTKPGDKRRNPACGAACFAAIVVDPLLCESTIMSRPVDFKVRSDPMARRGHEQISYSSGESRFSDHRPVHALFSLEVDNYNHLQAEIASPAAATSANNCSSNPSSCSRVQAEEMLVITRTRSCMSTTRFR